MRANELMLGDWVLHDGEPYQIRQLGIYGEDRDGKDYPAVCVGKPKGIGLIVERDEIEPIPLTPKILEKNGFKKTLDEDDTECYRHYNRAADGYIKITLYDDGDGSWSIEIVNYDKFDDNEIKYKNEFSFLKIHELQHALRLCGINKEIDI